MWSLILGLSNLMPILILVLYTYSQILKSNNYRTTLFTWILYLIYLPFDNVMWFLLSSNVYLVISLMIKVIIVFTITDTKAKLLNRIIDLFEPQIMIDIMRSKSINLTFLAYIQGTKLLMSFLQHNEADMFRQNTIHFLKSTRPLPFIAEPALNQNISYHQNRGQNKVLNKKPNQGSIIQISSQSQAQLIKSSQKHSVNNFRKMSDKQPIISSNKQSIDLINLLQDSSDNSKFQPITLKSNPKSNFKPIQVYYQAEPLNPNRISILLQMGTKNYPRLQKYSLQINYKQLSIFSTHGRLFEKHQLVQIRPLPDQFYQLVFQGTGLIQSRIVKFLGNFDKLKRFIKHM